MLDFKAAKPTKNLLRHWNCKKYSAIGKIGENPAAQEWTFSNRNGFILRNNTEIVGNEEGKLKKV